MDPIQALALAQDSIQQKLIWASDPASRDRAASQAANNRDLLRSNGFGWVADLIDSNDTLEAAQSALPLISARLNAMITPTNTAPPPASTLSAPGVAPTAGGSPQQTNTLRTSGAVAQANPASTAGGIVQSVTQGITGALSGAVGAVNTGIQTGASGLGAAAGGLAQTAATVIRAVWLPVVAILGILAFSKVFRIKIGGGR